MKRKRAGLVALFCAGLGVILWVLFFMPTSGPVWVRPAEPLLGLVLNQNFVVIGLDPGSPAQKAGIQPGDTLTRVGSQTLLPPADPRPAIRAEITGVTRPITKGNQLGLIETSELPVVVRRGGRELTFSIKPGSPTRENTKSPQPLPTITPAPGKLFYV